MAAFAIILGSLFVLLAAWEEMSQIHSLDTRERLQGELSGTGIDINQSLMLLRGSLLVSAACAVVASVLGYQVLRRDRIARIGLSVVALPLFVTGLSLGDVSFVSSLVAAFAVMLWFQPARDWFDGRTPAQAEAAAMRARPGPVGASTPPPVPPTVSAPQGPAQPGPPAPYAGPYGSPYGVPVSRPSRLMLACILTWTFTALIALTCLLLVAMMLGSPDLVLDEARKADPNFDQGLSNGEIVTATVFMGSVCVLWSLVAFVFAVVAWLGKSWGRTALLLTVAPAALLLVISAVVSFVTAIPAIAAIVTVVALMHPTTRAFFAQRDRMRS